MSARCWQCKEVVTGFQTVCWTCLAEVESLRQRLQRADEIEDLVAMWRRKEQPASVVVSAINGLLLAGVASQETK